MESQPFQEILYISFIMNEKVYFSLLSTTIRVKLGGEWGLSGGLTERKYTPKPYTPKTSSKTETTSEDMFLLIFRQKDFLSK